MFLKKKLKVMNGLFLICMYEVILKYFLFIYIVSLKCYIVVCLDNMIYIECF